MRVVSPTTNSILYSAHVAIAQVFLSGLVVGIFFVAGCKPAESSAKPMSVVMRPDGKWNVILISVDTLRPDRLGCYGYKRNTSPSIDRLAKRGVRFESVISECSWTAPAHMTLFTGLYPTTHGITAPGVSLWNRIPTLPEVLKRDGYRTFAYTGGGNVAAYYGFGRGFERYVVSGEGKNGLKSCALDKAIVLAQEQIERFQPEEPYFIFVHGYDVHSPYEAWEPWASRFRSPDAEPFDDYLRDDFDFRKRGYRLSPGNIKFLSDLYDAGVARADQLLGGFFEFLERRGELERTIVVFLSDHGEEFGEHGSVGHYGTIYPECLRVPLVIVGPGLAPGVVRQSVGLKDVMPTLLQLVGIPAPPSRGCSLVPLMRGEHVPPWPMFSETDYGVHLRSVIWEGHQMIRKAYDSVPRLFDLRTDPNANRDMAKDHPQRVTELMAIMPDPPADVAVHDLTPDVDIDALRALGYVGSRN